MAFICSRVPPPSLTKPPTCRRGVRRIEPHPAALVGDLPPENPLAACRWLNDIKGEITFGIHRP